jgi:hypothetical protein
MMTTVAGDAALRRQSTANIKDFIPLDARYRAAGQAHAGLILVSAKTFPQNRSYTSAVTSALAALLDKHEQIEASQGSHSGEKTFRCPRPVTAHSC